MKELTTMVDAAGPEEVRTGLVADALRHHKWLIVVCAVVGLALGYGASFASSSTYTSKATVLINPLPGNPYSPDGSGDSLTNLETEAQLVRSDVLASEVAQATGLGPEVLQQHLTVTVPINTQIVDISYTSANAEQAQAVVNDYADAYLATRQNNRDDVVTEQASSLERQINETQTKLQDATGITNDPFQAKLAQTLTGQLASLRIQAAQIAGSGRNPGEVISPGVAAGTPNGLALSLTLIGGLLLGLMVAVLLAVSRERSSHILRHVEQVEQAGLPVLGVFTGKSDENRAAVYRQVRAGLAAAPRITVAVAATRGGTAAGVVAAGLAQSYTHSPENVALVDADGAATSGLAQGQPGPVAGLSDVLLGQASLDQALTRLTPDAPTSIHLLPPGTDLEGGAERYASESMTALLADLHSRCAHVLVAAPGLCEPDGTSLAGQADALVMVVILNSTSYADVVAAKDWLDRSGTAVMGAVVIAEVGRKSPFSGRLERAATAAVPNAEPTVDTGATSGASSAGTPVDANLERPDNGDIERPGAVAAVDADVSAEDRAVDADDTADDAAGRDDDDGGGGAATDRAAGTGVAAPKSAAMTRTSPPAGQPPSDWRAEHTSNGRPTTPVSSTSGRDAPSVPHG